MNNAFTYVFCCEAALKLTAFGVSFYFQEAWNVFDFGVVCLSLTGVIVSYATTAKTSFLSLLRVLRVARVFRIIKQAKGLRTLFNTLIVSLPALANVGSVMMLFYFIYSVLGMNLFGHIVENFCLYRHVNFYDFPTAMKMLARMSTGENWNCIMHSTMITTRCMQLTVPGDNVTVAEGLYGSATEQDLLNADAWVAALPGSATFGSALLVDLNSPLVDTWTADFDPEFMVDGCTPFGSTAVSIIYFCSFMVLCAYVMLNLVVAVIIDNFQTEKSESDSIVNKDHIEQFVEVWSQLDPHTTGFVPSAKLEYIVRNLDSPLGVADLNNRKPAPRKVLDMCVRARVPIRNGNSIHFMETLYALNRMIARPSEEQALPAEDEAAMDEILAKKIPFDLHVPPRVTSAHAMSALYVQGALRGWLARNEAWQKKCAIEQLRLEEASPSSPAACCFVHCFNSSRCCAPHRRSWPGHGMRLG